jgi:hypothetical protein
MFRENKHYKTGIRQLIEFKLSVYSLVVLCIGTNQHTQFHFVPYNIITLSMFGN